MLRPTIKEIKEIASEGKYDIAPVSMELLSDIKTPIQVLKILKNVSGHCYMLESAAPDEKWGRYTFLGFDPKMEITCIDGRLTCQNGSSTTVHTDDPGSFLREVLSRYKSPKLPGMPSFTGGLVGYFAYDYMKYPEPGLRLDADDSDDFRDIDLMLFDKVIVFDNFRQKLILIANIDLTRPEESYSQAERELGELAELIRTGEETKDNAGYMTEKLHPLFKKEEFCQMVDKAKEYIYEGDIFQIVLSNRLEAGFEGSLLDTYRILRTMNPSPYMFYFSGSDMEVAGASPETLVKLEDGVLHTFPLAGTRPRGKTTEEDNELEKDLLSDEKELAEHNMLVDLGRNDIGRISRFGTVEVENYHSILRFSHVMHIGSTVKGELADGRDAIDAIDAILPAGTLSGAPKIRACQLINELENNKRGIYGGAIGYIDFTGNLDTCIAIRIAYKKNGKVFIRSGAGIVADSVPENEFRECLNKAGAVADALNAAAELKEKEASE